MAEPDRDATPGRHPIRAALRLGGRTVGSLRRAATGLVLPTRFDKSTPGAKPGIEHEELAELPSADEPSRVFCLDFAPDDVDTREIHDLEAFLADHRQDWVAVRWINVDGTRDMKVIQSLARKYGLHPLAVEDVLHVPQRPKVDAYPGDGEHQARVLVICRMIQMRNSHLHGQQASIFLGHKTVLTFQETHGDVWQAIRRRIYTSGSRLRRGDASFLVYCLVDAVVDHWFPILEHYGDRLEELEDEVLGNPDPGTVQEVHDIKRELLLFRRAVWPMREVVSVLQREPHECLTEDTRAYLRDVYDHVVQAMDITETYREVATGLTETYMTAMSNRMNEIMKVLTLMGTIFIPLTFLAGVWGMNFHQMPELETEAAYPWVYPIGFWGICLAIAGGMVAWFRHRRWL
jgi:magnesium transporter